MLAIVKQPSHRKQFTRSDGLQTGKSSNPPCTPEQQHSCRVQPRSPKHLPTGQTGQRRQLPAAPARGTEHGASAEQRRREGPAGQSAAQQWAAARGGGHGQPSAAARSGGGLQPRPHSSSCASSGAAPHNPSPLLKAVVSRASCPDTHRHGHFAVRQRHLKSAFVPAH